MLVLVVEQLHANLELLGVVQIAPVNVGNAPGAGIDVLALVEVTDLFLTADLREGGSPAGRVGATADPVAGLQHRDVVAGV